MFIRTNNFYTLNTLPQSSKSFTNKDFQGFYNKLQKAKNALADGNDSKISLPIGHNNEPSASDTHSQKAKPLDRQRVEPRKPSKKQPKKPSQRSKEQQAGNSNQNWEHQSKQQIGVKSDIPPP